MRVGWGVGWVAVVAWAVGFPLPGDATAQITSDVIPAQKTEPAAKSAERTSSEPAKLPEVKVPEVKTPDYFGPSFSQPFNEKSLFPTPAPVQAPPAAEPAADPPKTQAPDGLPPLPLPPPTLVVPDGSLTPPPVPPPPPPPKKRWKGGVEFGVNGSEGNSDVFSLRLGANADRKWDHNLFHLDFLYTITRQDGTTRQNQAILNLRDEFLFRNSPWSLFAATQVEYDEFRAYDLRAGTYGGFSYRWLKSDSTLFKTRLGAGAVREIDTRGGSTPDRWVAEAVIGADFNHRFTDRQGFVSSVDTYPNLSQLGQYRVRARAGYEIVIDPDHGMVLRLGVQDRYDSSPGTARRNDLNYFATLLFRF